MPTAATSFVWPVGDAELTLLIEPDRPVLLAGLAAPSGEHLGQEAASTDPGSTTPLVELSLDAEGRAPSSPGSQLRRFAASRRLRPVDRSEHAEGDLRVLQITQRDTDTGTSVTTRIEHRTGASAIRMITTVANQGDQSVTLRHLSGLNAGFGDAPIGEDPERWALGWARNAWFAEFRWATSTLEQAGVVDIGLSGGGNDSSAGLLEVAGVGSWSTGGYLPLGCLDDRRTGRSWAWQIEHNGGWVWQALDVGRRLQITVSGPSDQRHAWSVTLAPGEDFTGVPVSLAFSADGREGVLGELTRHRRLIRRPNADNRGCPVIFNDYMNALMGDPTTERLLPLIEAAGAAGSEYFVIDAGWYSDEPGWWDSVGEWQPSTTRFPGGLGEVIGAIRDRGMVPGLWLEPEVVGVHSPLLQRLPAEALFCRDGSPLTENGRHQLDLRHPAAREHLDRTVDRLVGDFGIGYFKFDYNINIGLGTDVGDLSLGAGLLGHNRAYDDWIDGLFERHPDLVIENCSSGGMRVDYAQLSRLSLQSTSDQTDPLLYAPIAAAAPTAVTPEQAAIWAYPQPDWSTDVNDLTLVNALLGRIHLSGRIDLMEPAAAGRVAEAVGVYRRIRGRIPDAMPIWPLGLPGWYDPWCSVGLRDEQGVLLQVWRRGGEQTVRLPLPQLAGRAVQPRVLFPTDSGAGLDWSVDQSELVLTLPRAPQAVLIALDA